MKGLWNCHTKGLHSIVLDETDSLLTRVFFTTHEHDLWKNEYENPRSIAIHGHHVDIKITMLFGSLKNHLYIPHEYGSLSFKSWLWQSKINTGTGSFTELGSKNLIHVTTQNLINGQTLYMSADELHTVEVNVDECVAWLIQEYKPVKPYTSINYSNEPLDTWSPDELYLEMTQDEIKPLIQNIFK